MLRLCPIMWGLPSFIYAVPCCYQKAAFGNFLLFSLLFKKKNPLIFFWESWLEELTVITICAAVVLLRSPQRARFSPPPLALTLTSRQSIDTRLPFSICHVYLTGHFILPNNVPGSDLTVQMVCLWCPGLSRGALWTHGGGRPEAREEISECGLIIQYFSQQDPQGHKEQSWKLLPSLR